MGSTRRWFGALTFAALLALIAGGGSAWGTPRAVDGRDFSCVPAPAYAPRPPPLPAFAAADRAAAGLTNALPLCPSGEVPRPVPRDDGNAPAGGRGNALFPASPVTAPQSAPYVQEPCLLVSGNPSTWICHELEQEDNINEVGLFTTMGEYAAAVAPGDPGAHSIGQLWGAAHNFTSTLETGWSVAPTQWGDNQPHLFEFHTGDSYGADSCYDGCGFSSLPGAAVVAGQALTPGIHAGFGVELSAGYWFFYYGGGWYGYVPEYDASWHGGVITRINTAQVGGEVASTISSCPRTQMGDGALGSRHGGAVDFVQMIDPGGNFASPHYFAPNVYVSRAPSLYSYNIGYANVTGHGDFRFGGPGLRRQHRTC